MFVLVILVYVLIAIIEGVPLIKSNNKKEIFVYSFFLITAFVMSLLLSLGVKIPSPAIYIQKVVETVIGK